MFDMLDMYVRARVRSNAVTAGRSRAARRHMGGYQKAVAASHSRAMTRALPPLSKIAVTASRSRAYMPLSIPEKRYTMQKIQATPRNPDIDLSPPKDIRQGAGH